MSNDYDYDFSNPGYIAALAMSGMGGPYMCVTGEPIDFSPLWFMLKDAVTALYNVLSSAVKATAAFMSQVVLPVLKSVFTQCLKILTSAISTFLCFMQKGLLFRAGAYAVADPREIPMTSRFFANGRSAITYTAFANRAPTAH